MSASAIDMELLQAATEMKNSERKTDAPPAYHYGMYRSVDDVKMLRIISLATLAQSFLLIASVGVIAFLATRPPQQVVIERMGDSDRVVAINGKSVAAGYSVGEDKPRSGDKKTLAREWTTVRYAIDPLTREKDIARIYTFMDPTFARVYAKLMKQRGEFETEARDQIRSVWTPQLVEIDRQDPYKVKVIGTWDITGKDEKGHGWARQMKQLIFTLCLVEDDRGRAPRNSNTGFLIRDIQDYREIQLPTPSSSSVTAAETPQN